MAGLDFKIKKNACYWTHGGFIYNISVYISTNILVLIMKGDCAEVIKLRVTNIGCSVLRHIYCARKT